jgi:hypothetical protein
MFKKIKSQQLIIGLLVLTLAACAATPPLLASGPTAPPTQNPAKEVPATETSTAADPSAASVSYPIVDTGQTVCYDASGAATACPTAGSTLFGQDAQYTGNAPSYTDNGDGTITDNVTGLMWQKSPDTNGDGTINAADKLTYDEALAGAETLTLGGYSDWRLPTIKELYSLILFDGIDPSGLESSPAVTLIPFIDTTYFDFAYGDTAAGERIIDAQFASSTKYVATTMNGAETMFGVNFADGRIKGYPAGPMPGQSQGKAFYVLYVRGDMDYGNNDLTDNGDSTITDNATGLMWSRDDSGTDLNWEEALAWVAQKNVENYLGYDDWRLPNVKELQSIVDYSRSPDTTGSAAIDPLFNVTSITNEAGQTDYPAYWSSTTHANFRNGMNAAYVNFGRSMGYMNNAWIDVHGAGAQRSDPKTGDPGAWSTGHGPQGDAIRIYNFVRLVRGGDVTLDLDGDPTATRVGITVDAGSSQPAQPSGTPGQQDGQGGPPPNDQQQPGGMPGQPDGPGGQPPQEAIDACTGQTQGASCQFSAPHGEVAGTCNLILSQLACVPAGGPPSRQ